MRDIIQRYAALRRIMLATFQNDCEAYYNAEQEMRELINKQLKNNNEIEQAIYYQNIIIDCERHMPLPMEQTNRTAGSYNIHRYTQEEYQQAKDNLERLLQYER